MICWKYKTNKNYSSSSSSSLNNNKINKIYLIFKQNIKVIINRKIMKVINSQIFKTMKAYNSLRNIIKNF